MQSGTVIRLDNGEFWAWEGQFTNEGSCEGSCTHVWNYQQTLPYLFPALERSLRDTDYAYNQLPNGGLTFRQIVPASCLSPRSAGSGPPSGGATDCFDTWNLRGGMRGRRRAMGSAPHPRAAKSKSRRGPTSSA